MPIFSPEFSGRRRDMSAGHHPDARLTAPTAVTPIAVTHPGPVRNRAGTGPMSRSAPVLVCPDRPSRPRRAPGGEGRAVFGEPPDGHTYRDPDQWSAARSEPVPHRRPGGPGGLLVHPARARRLPATGRSAHPGRPAGPPPPPESPVVSATPPDASARRDIPRRGAHRVFRTEGRMNRADPGIPVAAA